MNIKRFALLLILLYCFSTPSFSLADPNYKRGSVFHFSFLGPPIFGYSSSTSEERNDGSDENLSTESQNFQTSFFDFSDPNIGLEIGYAIGGHHDLGATVAITQFSSDSKLDEGAGNNDYSNYIRIWPYYQYRIYHGNFITSFWGITTGFSRSVNVDNSSSKNNKYEYKGTGWGLSTRFGFSLFLAHYASLDLINTLGYSIFNVEESEYQTIEIEADYYGDPTKVKSESNINQFSVQSLLGVSLWF